MATQTTTTNNGSNGNATTAPTVNGRVLTAEERLAYGSAYHHLSGVIVTLRGIGTGDEAVPDKVLASILVALKQSADVCWKRSQDGKPAAPNVNAAAKQAAQAAAAQTTARQGEGMGTAPTHDDDAVKAPKRQGNSSQPLTPPAPSAPGKTTAAPQRDEWTQAFLDRGKGGVQTLLGVKWTEEKARLWCVDNSLSKVPSLPVFMTALMTAARLLGMPVSDSVAPAVSAPVIAPAPAVKAQPAPVKASKPAPVATVSAPAPVVTPTVAPAVPDKVTVDGFTFPTRIPADRILGMMGLPALCAMLKYHGMGQTSDKAMAVSLLSARRDTPTTAPAAPVSAPAKGKAKGQQTAPTGQGEGTSAPAPVATTKKAPPSKEKASADTVRPTQIRILRVMADGRSRTWESIATTPDETTKSGITAAVSDRYWIGTMNEAVNDATESKRNCRPLCRHGFVSMRTEQMASDKGSIYEATVYTITDAGREYLAALDEAAAE